MAVGNSLPPPSDDEVDRRLGGHGLLELAATAESRVGCDVQGARGTTAHASTPPPPPHTPPHGPIVTARRATQSRVTWNDVGLLGGDFLVWEPPAQVVGCRAIIRDGIARDRRSVPGHETPWSARCGGVRTGWGVVRMSPLS